MGKTIHDIQERLASNGSLEVELEIADGMLLVKSDDFDERRGEIPDAVHVYSVESGLFDVRPVGTGGELFERTFQETIHYITDELIE